MDSVAMTGNDTLGLNGTLLTGLADGDCVEITFEGDIATVKRGKNGNTIYALNEAGMVAAVKIRTILGGMADKFMNGLLSSQRANFAGFPLMTGKFVKKVGDGTGVITTITYPLRGGIFTKNVGGANNVEGDIKGGIAEYMLKFSNAPRAIGQ
jgi:hypothetical protein